MNNYLQDLSEIIPVDPKEEIVLHVTAQLDGSFEVNSINRLFKVLLPEYGAKQEEFVKLKKGSENWSVGVRVYKDGADIKYQSFFWKDGPPPGNGSLAASGSPWCEAGPIIRYDAHLPSGATSRSKIEKYKWLVCDAASVQVDFSQSVSYGKVIPRPTSMTTAVVTEDKGTNETNQPITKTLTISYDKEQTATTTISDTHSFTAGTTLNWKNTVKYIAGATTFSVGVKLAYTYEHGSSETTSKAEKYVFRQELPITIPPNESRYVSLQIQQDSNATADVMMAIQVKGRVGGTVLSGDDLLQIAKFMDKNTVVDKQGADYLNYKLQGTVVANVVFSGNTIVSSTPTLQE